MPKILSATVFLLVAFLVVPAAWAATGSTAKTPVAASDDHVLGDAKAPVTVIEYASLTCPHCAAFEQKNLPKIKKAWIDTGKVRLIYRDFPLDHYALEAAMIARCAPEDRYFQFIESFFDAQENWVTASDPLVALEGIARLGGMAPDALERCLADKRLEKSVIDTEMTAKNDYGVESTPTFFIIGPNGTTSLIGDQSYDDFGKALAAAMPKS